MWNSRVSCLTAYRISPRNSAPLPAPAGPSLYGILRVCARPSRSMNRSFWLRPTLSSTCSSGRWRSRRARATPCGQGQLTLAWWDRTRYWAICAELFSALYPNADWEDLLDDAGRLLIYRHEQRDLLQRWRRLRGHDSERSRSFRATTTSSGRGTSTWPSTPKTPNPSRLTGSDGGGNLREIIIGGRSIRVTHRETVTTEVRRHPALSDRRIWLGAVRIL